MTIHEFLSKLEGVKRCGTGWVARCPAHEDSHPSLTIGDAKGRILINCKRGCTYKAVVAALGLKESDLFEAKNGKSCIAATYDYTDEKGDLLFQSVRYEPKDFSQRRPDPAKRGGWIANLNGVRHVLYRLPELTKAIAGGHRIFVVEGEKDADTLIKECFATTTNPMGAGKWRAEYTETLRGVAAVVIIADKDEAGRKHAGVVAKALHGAVKSLKLLELSDRAGKSVKDTSDWFAAGGTPEEFNALVDNAQEFVPTEEKIDDPITPAKWYDQRHPGLSDEHGPAIWEETNKQKIVLVRGIGEDFHAATLGHKGCPHAPTVFMPTEDKFYTYEPSQGVFVHQREPFLLARLSNRLLEAARACKRDNCETNVMEFRYRDAAKLSGVLRKARGLLEVPYGFFSNDLTEFIPCANGMLRLGDKKLLPFSPSYRRRNKLAVPYDPTAKCPMFLDTLMRPALEADDLDLLQRACGLFLIGENISQTIVILSGTAGGGKGTFVRVLNGIIGETNLATLRPQLLGERFELGRFLGKTLLYGADAPADFLNQRGASVLKSLTGYDPMTLEFKNSNESPSIICRFNVVITCNTHLVVHLEGDPDGWRRRMAIVGYHKPKPERVIANLDKQILSVEAPGVLNWMVDGLDKLRADEWQLNLTDQQQRIVDDLLLESAGHTVFVRERIIKADGRRLTVTHAFASYVEFCTEHGWAALTQNEFGRVIGDAVVREFGITTRNDIPDSGGKAKRGWSGLAIREINVSTCKSKFTETSETLLPVHPIKMTQEKGTV